MTYWYSFNIFFYVRIRALNTWKMTDQNQGWSAQKFPFAVQNNSTARESGVGFNSNSVLFNLFKFTYIFFLQEKRQGRGGGGRRGRGNSSYFQSPSSGQVSRFKGFDRLVHFSPWYMDTYLTFGHIKDLISNSAPRRISSIPPPPVLLFHILNFSKGSESGI